MRACAFILLLGLTGCGVHTFKDSSSPTDECIFQSDVDPRDGRDNDCDGKIDEDDQPRSSIDGGSLDVKSEPPCRGSETCGDGIACTDDVCTPEGCRHFNNACTDQGETPPKPNAPKQPEFRSCEDVNQTGAIDALVVNSTFLRVIIAGTVSTGLVDAANNITSVSIGSASDEWNTTNDYWSESWHGEGNGVLYTFIIPRTEFVPRVRANGTVIEFDLCRWKLTGVLKRQLATLGRAGEVLVAP